MQLSSLCRLADFPCGGCAQNSTALRLDRVDLAVRIETAIHRKCSGVNKARALFSWRCFSRFCYLTCAQQYNQLVRDLCFNLRGALLCIYDLFVITLPETDQSNHDLNDRLYFGRLPPVRALAPRLVPGLQTDRKSTRLNSSHT